jgi:hypothetical protein
MGARMLYESELPFTTSVRGAEITDGFLTEPLDRNSFSLVNMLTYIFRSIEY